MSLHTSRNAIAVLLAAGALTLGACGGDDGGDTVGATQPTVKTTGTTGTTKTDRTDTTRERTGTNEDRTSTRERGDDSGGSKKGGSGSDGNSGGGSRGNDSGSTSQPAAQPGNVRKVAQTVCNSFLPKAIERDLEQDDRKPEDVARNYSKGFPENQREAAYEGCLAGLKKRK